MFVQEVVWNHPRDPDGNTHHFRSLGYDLDDIDAILKDSKNEVQRLADRGDSDLMGITYGTTSAGKRIGVIWVFECGNPVHIMPVDVIV